MNDKVTPLHPINVLMTIGIASLITATGLGMIIICLEKTYADGFVIGSLVLLGSTWIWKDCFNNGEWKYG